MKSQNRMCVETEVSCFDRRRIRSVNIADRRVQFVSFSFRKVSLQLVEVRQVWKADRNLEFWEVSSVKSFRIRSMQILSGVSFVWSKQVVSYSRSDKVANLSIVSCNFEFVWWEIWSFVGKEIYYMFCCLRLAIMPGKNLDII